MTYYFLKPYFKSYQLPCHAIKGRISIVAAGIKIGLFWCISENFVYSRIVEMEVILWDAPRTNNLWIEAAAFNDASTVFQILMH